MKPTSIAALILLGAVTLIAQQVPPGSPVIATLTLPASSVLPGVPFDMFVAVKNVSKKPVSAGLVAQLHVTLPDGTKFVAPDRYILQPNQFSAPETSVELAAGESRQFATTWQYADPPNWSRQPEFSRPGLYRLMLVLEDTQERPQNYAGPIQTTTAELRRAVAPGEDQDLWNRMQALSNGQWSDDGFTRLREGRVLLEEILKLHPASQYYPYAVLLRAPASEEGDVTRALEAAARFRQSPAYPYLLKYAGDGAMSQALKAGRRGDARQRDELYGAAAKYYAAVLDAATNVAVRADAQNRQSIARGRGR